MRHLQRCDENLTILKISLEGETCKFIQYDVSCETPRQLNIENVHFLTRLFHLWQKGD